MFQASTALFTWVNRSTKAERWSCMGGRDPTAVQMSASTMTAFCDHIVGSSSSWFKAPPNQARSSKRLPYGHLVSGMNERPGLCEADWLRIVGKCEGFYVTTLSAVDVLPAVWVSGCMGKGQARCAGAIMVSVSVYLCPCWASIRVTRASSLTDASTNTASNTTSPSPDHGPIRKKMTAANRAEKMRLWLEEWLVITASFQTAFET